METVAQCVAGVVRLARRLDELSEDDDTHAEFYRDDVRATLVALLHLGSNSEAAAHAASAIARLRGFPGISSRRSCARAPRKGRQEMSCRWRFQPRGH